MTAKTLVFSLLGSISAFLIRASNGTFSSAEDEDYFSTFGFGQPQERTDSCEMKSTAFLNSIGSIAGTLGTLIGADLTNLRDIPSLGAPVASIGGAGTFDGVFLSGIIAVLLV